MAVVTLRDALSTGAGLLVGRGAVLVILAACTAALFLRERWRLSHVRLIEALMFATLTVYLAARAWTGGPGGADAIDATRTLMAFGLLAIAYGVFVPNPIGRALTGIGLIVGAPVAVGLLATGERAGASGLAVAFGDRWFEAALLLGASTVVAAVAAFLTITLFNFAYDQRRRTFYDLERRIGSGGMGEVWIARQETLARPTAVKLIREDRIEGIDGEDARRVLLRFEREAKATAALRSPHTIDVYDFGVTADGHFFYAMEYLDGLDLEDLVDKFGPVPAERAVHFLLQACDSLADAHDSDLTHRDIKPANLFLSRLGPSSDYITLLDFGLVQYQSGTEMSEKLTAEGTASGTPAYMAPEMAVERDGVDCRSDIYALGCVAYWLVTGKQVFEAETSVAVIVEHVKTPPTPPSQRTELPIPAELESVIMKCLEKDPAERYQSSRELAAALRDVRLADAWTTQRADGWWDLHAPAASAA